MTQEPRANEAEIEDFLDWVRMQTQAITLKKLAKTLDCPERSLFDWYNRRTPPPRRIVQVALRLKEAKNEMEA